MRPRRSLILSKQTNQNKSVSQLRMRLPIVKIKPNDSPKNVPLKNKHNLIMSLHKMRQHKSLSLLPPTKNIRLEGKQISEYGTLYINAKRKSIQCISRNPYNTIKFSNDNTVCDAYGILMVGKDECIKLLPTIKQKCIGLHFSKATPLYICLLYTSPSPRDS